MVLTLFCIALIAHPIYCLICQTIHLKVVFSPTASLTEALEHDILLSEDKLVAVITIRQIQCPLRGQIQTLLLSRYLQAGVEKYM